jgi:hypothetical protein
MAAVVEVLAAVIYGISSLTQNAVTLILTRDTAQLREPLDIQARRQVGSITEDTRVGQHMPRMMLTVTGDIMWMMLDRGRMEGVAMMVILQEQLVCHHLLRQSHRRAP